MLAAKATVLVSFCLPYVGARILLQRRHWSFRTRRCRVDSVPCVRQQAVRGGAAAAAADAAVEALGDLHAARCPPRYPKLHDRRGSDIGASDEVRLAGEHY
jgi:hypothetical protein